MPTKSGEHISTIAEAKAVYISNFARHCIISFQEVAPIDGEWEWLFISIKDYPAYTSMPSREPCNTPRGERAGIIVIAVLEIRKRRPREVIEPLIEPESDPRSQSRCSQWEHRDLTQERRGRFTVLSSQFRPRQARGLGALGDPRREGG